MNINHSLLGAIRSNILAKLISQVISWAGAILILREIDNTALGAYALASIALGYAMLAYEGGLLETFVQRYPTGVDEERGALALLLAVGIMLAVLLGCAGMIVSGVNADSQVGILMLGMAPLLLVTAAGILPQARLMQRMQFDVLAKVSSVQALVATGLSVILIHQGAGSWGLLAGLAGGAITRAVMLNTAAPGVLRPSLRPALDWRTIRFANSLIVDNLLWRLYTSIDSILISATAGIGAVGTYALAQQVANMPLEKLSTVVNDASLPAYGTLRAAGQATSDLLRETIRGHAIIGIPIYWGLAATADLLVPAMFGDKWNAAIIPLVLLSTIAPLRLAGSVETPVLTAHARPGLLIRSKLVIVPPMVIGLWAGVRQFGIVGAAAVWVAVFPVFYLIAFRYVIREVGISYRELFHVVRGPIAAGAVMVLCVIGGKSGLQVLQVDVIPKLACAVLAGVLSYPVALAILDPSGFAAIVRRLRFVTTLTGQK